MTTPEIRLKFPLTNEAFAALGAPELVYVRGLTAADALADHPEVFADSDSDLAPDQVVYAVHRADGARLAIVTDRAQAYAAAYAHDLAPVSVH